MNKDWEFKHEEKLKMAQGQKLIGKLGRETTLADAFIDDNSKMQDKLKDFLTGKIKRGYKVGVEAFDNHFAFKKNEFYVMTGKKGSGKTTINQALQVMASIVNDLIWVVAFQENENWAMRLNYMNFLLGDNANYILKAEPKRYKIVSDWIDKHFIFLNVDTLSEALDMTENLIENGTDVYGLVLDPVNSFENDLGDGGNSYSDGVKSGQHLLKYSLNVCSIFLNQHPIMSGQRQQGAITSYDGEGGWFLNKASFTYVINREDGNNNELIVENVRNRHTGGNSTDKENPVIIEWFPTKINIRYKDGSFSSENVIQAMIMKHKPFVYDGMEKQAKQISDAEFDRTIPNATVTEAFGDDKSDVPF